MNKKKMFKIVSIYYCVFLLIGCISIPNRNEVYKEQLDYILEEYKKELNNLNESLKKKCERDIERTNEIELLLKHKKIDEATALDLLNQLDNDMERYKLEINRQRIQLKEHYNNRIQELRKEIFW